MRLGEERRNHGTPLLRTCGPQRRALGSTPGISHPGPRGAGSLGCPVKGSTVYGLRRVSGGGAEGSWPWGARGDSPGSCPGSRLVSFDFEAISAGRDRKNIVTLNSHSGEATEGPTPGRPQ